MDECETLCGRLVIMVNGRFQCLGSPQHLKSKFGRGYTLVVKVTAGNEETKVTNLCQFVETTFTSCALKDRHHSMLNYHIGDISVPWSRVFGLLEANRSMLHIEDYLVSQTTLEQVFINFARIQQPPDESNVGNCCYQCCHRSPCHEDDVSLVPVTSAHNV